jgi:hypothetical protein
MIAPSAQLWFFFQSYWSPVYLFLPLWINFYSSQKCRDDGNGCVTELMEK